MPTWSIRLKMLFFWGLSAPGIRSSSQLKALPDDRACGSSHSSGNRLELQSRGRPHRGGHLTMAGSVIVNGARTPMGRLLGSLKDFSGADLGGFAIKAALERSGVSPEQVQYVIMGQVLQAGAGQIPARQAA